MAADQGFTDAQHGLGERIYSKPLIAANLFIYFNYLIIYFYYLFIYLFFYFYFCLIKGVCYMDGIVVEKNLDTAVKYFQLSAEQGHMKAKSKLGKTELRNINFTLLT